jgi:hypothetical protein
MINDELMIQLKYGVNSIEWASDVGVNPMYRVSVQEVKEP